MVSCVTTIGGGRPVKGYQFFKPAIYHLMMCPCPPLHHLLLCLVGRVLRTLDFVRVDDVHLEFKICFWPINMNIIEPSFTNLPWQKSSVSYHTSWPFGRSLQTPPDSHRPQGSYPNSLWRQDNFAVADNFDHVQRLNPKAT